MNYRADIDGMRALAVAEVVLFHADVPGFGGGYVGVDVFFVISGYLVTQLLTAGAELPVGHQIGVFYLRRARRILPALFMVSAATALGAALLCLPFDLVRFGRFLRLVPAMLANLAAWFEQDYFNSMEFCKPLLHLWSIAIEEQFYILYPLILLPLLRLAPRRVVPVLGAALLASLALCCYLASRGSILGYYFPGSRAWELLLGAQLALRPAWTQVSRRGAEGVAVLALAALLTCGCFYSAQTPYPGPATLLPCGAAALLILSGEGQGTRVSRILSGRVLVVIGLMSYALYLWHWPALTFLRYLSIEPPDAVSRVLVLGVVGLLSFVTWRYLETPLRRRQLVSSDGRFATLMLLSAAMLCGVGFLLAAAEGWPGRFPARVQRLAAPYTHLFRDAGRCAQLSDAAIRRGELCHYGPDGGVPRVVVWGDSHALVLLPAWQRLAQSGMISVDLVARSSCRPFFSGVSAECLSFNQSVLEALGRLKPDYLVAISFWNQPEARGRLAADPAAFPLQLEQLLARTQAAGRTLCLVLDPPILRYSPPYALAIGELRGVNTDFLAEDSLRARRADPMRGPAQAFAATGRLRLIDLKDAMCFSVTCQVLDGGESLYRDRDHLSEAGAHFVEPVLARCLAPGWPLTAPDAAEKPFIP